MDATEAAAAHGEAMTMGDDGVQGTHLDGGDVAEPDASAAVSMRVLVEAKDAGIVIGKRGLTIMQIREQSKCSVNLSDHRGMHDRILTVTGQPAEVFTAFYTICTKLQAENIMPETNTPAPLTLRLCIHKSQAGAIIGKQGATIRQLKENCNVNLRVTDTCLPFSSERECLITGDAAAVAQAVNAIAAVLQQTPMRGPANPYRPEVAATAAPAAAGAHMAMHQGMYDPSFVGHGMMSYPHPQTSHAQHHPQQGYMPAHHMPGVGMAQNQPMQQQINLEVPNEVIGAVIGSRGSKIAEIRLMSQASIKIGDRLPGSLNRTISITGSVQSCQAAVDMINQRVSEHQQETLARQAQQQQQMLMEQNMSQAMGQNMGQPPM